MNSTARSPFRLTSLAIAIVVGTSACGDQGGADAAKPARTAAPAAAGTPAAGAPAVQANFAPADTASRTVAEALSKPAAAAGDSAAQPDTTKPSVKFRAGEDPQFAAQQGWPVKGPKPLPGAILPENRIVCYYGNPNSKRMGALGEFPKDDMLRRLKGEVEKWTRADPAHPAKPCLHMVSVVAQGAPGSTGKYRTIAGDKDVQMVYDWAKEVNGIFFVDIQVGTDDIRNILPRFEWILKNPDVHIAVDPEFYMRGGIVPGRKIGTMHAADINYVTEYVAGLVKKYNLPPKVLVIHRFTRNMVTDTDKVILRPEVQIVMDMDGWGAPWLKRDSYRDYVVKYPVEYTGFKLFYNNDTKKGDPLMTPADLLKLEPKPLYIQYQ